MREAGNRLRCLTLLLALAVISGCAGLAGPPGPPPEVSPTVELTDVPFHPQRTHHCGPAALATVLGWTGVTVSPDELAPSLYIPEREGTLQPELLAQARRHGRLAYVLQPDINDLLRELEAGNPVLVLQNLALNWWPVWHYAVVVGYLPATDEVVLRSGTTRRLLQPIDTFRRTWARGGNWAVVALSPRRLPTTAEPGGFLEAAYALEKTAGTEDALLAYHSAMRRWPQVPGFPVAAANVLQGEGRTDEAEAILRAAVDRGIEDGVVYNNLALLLAARGERTAALTMARRAVAIGGPFEAEFRKTVEEIR